MMIVWWSKHVGVILNVLVCDIWINVLIQTSALVGPLYIVNWNARWNSEICYNLFRGYKNYQIVRSSVYNIITCWSDIFLFCLITLCCSNYVCFLKWWWICSRYGPIGLRPKLLNYKHISYTTIIFIKPLAFGQQVTKSSVSCNQRRDNSSIGWHFFSA
jgi:hypothetical protein